MFERSIDREHGLFAKNLSGRFIRSPAATGGTLKWAKDMESSRRYLLQAEIEFWHDMLRLNRSRVSRQKEEEMRACLKRAVRSLNASTGVRYRAAA